MKIFSNLEFSYIHKERMHQLADADEVFFGNPEQPSDEDKKVFLESEIAFGWCPPEWIEIASKLRWMQLDSVGFGEYAHLDWDKLGTQIVCTNLRGFFAIPVSETILAGVLALYRGIDELVELKIRKAWKKLELRPKLRTLTGSKVLLAGYGAIGQRFHALIKSFDCKIIIFDKYTPEANLRTFEELDKILPEVDILVLMLPDTQETRGLFSLHRFNIIKKGAIFINVGRGTLVDETALIRALNTKHLGGAVIDVTVNEPLPPDNALWDCPNVIITQHTAGGAHDELDKKISVFEDNLQRYRCGKPLRNIIEWKRGY